MRSLAGNYTVCQNLKYPESKIQEEPVKKIRRVSISCSTSGSRRVVQDSTVTASCIVLPL